MTKRRAVRAVCIVWAVCVAACAWEVQAQAPPKEQPAAPQAPPEAPSDLLTPALAAARAEAASLRVEVTPLERTAHSQKWSVRLTEASGQRFDMYLRAPLTGAGPWPAFIILAGFETGRAALDLVEDQQGFLLLSMDYPTHGQESLRGLSSLSDLQTVRDIALDTARGVTHALSYLHSRADLNPDQVVLLGVSFGGFFAAAVGARDPRPDAVVMIYGGGDIPMIIQHNMGSNLDLSARLTLTAAVNLLLGDFDPLRAIAQISPRPLLMINSRLDEMFPAASIDALYDRARDPKALVWYDTGHHDLFDPALLRDIAEVVIEHLRDQRVLPPAANDTPEAP